MGYLSGRATWERFEVGGKAVPLGQKHIEALERYSIDERLGSGGDARPDEEAHRQGEAHS